LGIPNDRIVFTCSHSCRRNFVGNIIWQNTNTTQFNNTISSTNNNTNILSNSTKLNITNTTTISISHNSTNLYYTDDFFSNNNEITQGVKNFYIDKSIFLVSKSKKDSNINLYISQPSEYSFTKPIIDISKKIKNFNTVTILDVTNNAIFLNILSESQKYGNTYKSNLDGKYFKKSINYNVLYDIEAGEFDFEKV